MRELDALPPNGYRIVIRHRFGRGFHGFPPHARRMPYMCVDQAAHLVSDRSQFLSIKEFM